MHLAGPCSQAALHVDPSLLPHEYVLQKFGLQSVQRSFGSHTLFSHVTEKEEREKNTRKMFSRCLDS